MESSVGPELEAARSWIDSRTATITALNDQIWRWAEPGLREYRSATALCGFLREAGFSVEEGVAGMPTAFVGTWGTEGPVIGLMAEYDATPGDSQAAVPYPSELDPDAGGFPDLHCGIGTASVAAAAAAAAALAQHGLPARLKVFGSPAEKLCVGKPFLARDGYFDGLDAVLAWHPRAYRTLEWDTGPGCYQAEVFDFRGVSVYGSSPWGGVSALDALTLMNVIVQFQREHIPRQYWASVNELVTVGGKHPTALPSHAQVWYVYRSPSRAGILHVQEMLGRAAEAACLALGARYERRMVASARPWLPNHALAGLVYRNLERVGPPRFPAAMKAMGREVLQALGLPDDPEPFDEQLSPPEAGVSAGSAGGADDVTEFCWHAPTARLYVTYGLRAGRLPNWAGAAFAGTPVGHATVLTAARTLALSVVDAVQHPEVLEAAWTEWRERTTIQRIPPLLPPEARPPVELSFAPHYPRGWRPPTDRGED
jgi:aminobenzoyl-glutamate utilization protein B